MLITIITFFSLANDFDAYRSISIPYVNLSNNNNKMWPINVLLRPSHLTDFNIFYIIRITTVSKFYSVECLEKHRTSERRMTIAS